MSTEPPTDAKPESRIVGFLWVFIPAMIVIAGLASLFDLTP
jgi:hypothetical protein